MMFKPVDSKVDFPKLEERILKFWKEKKIFEKSLDQTKNGERFVFYEGPPTANGKPHIGHVLARSFKDLFPRFKTMQGYYVIRRAGWDSHGLPVELEVEEELGITGKKQIEEFGIEKFNRLCRESVFRYIDVWERMTERMGFWIDLKDPYVVLNKEYIESLWWILKRAYEKNLLVKDYKVTPYCPRCQTPISSHELAQGYKDNVKDPSLYVKFRLRGSSRFVEASQSSALLVWTTTPWTLLGNVALAVDPTALYTLVKNGDDLLILAKERLEVLDDGYKIISEFKGQDLLNLDYEPLFGYVSYDKKAHYIVPANFVDLSEGTGIVHAAVMYGEEDFELGQEFDLPKKHVVDEEGRFIETVKPFAGVRVWDATAAILADLKKRDLLYKSGTIYHTYPYCWRCKTKLIYYALESWFLKMTTVKEKLLENNSRINWYPSHIKGGRMGDWLRNVKDWSISRWRYWGTPLPVWRCRNCKKEVVIGSYAELQKMSIESVDLDEFDPHRPFIDGIYLRCPECQGKMHRYKDVVDTWFDSGGMPYAQWHYPFENKKLFEQQFPADYICEGIDQTRGWFYTLLAEATVLGRANPYKNVLSTELVLDENGQKMSKSVGNVIDPFAIFDQFGADVVRWYFYSASQIGKPYRMSENDLAKIQRRFLNILWNIYRFFVTNANLDRWKLASAIPTTSQNILDRWLLSRLNNLVGTVTESLENYNAYAACRGISRFVVEDFSQWYIRRSRGRVGPRSSNLEDKENFYATTYHVLLRLVALLAPFIPFLTEEIYQNLRSKGDPESVHLVPWPVVERGLVDRGLEVGMNTLRDIVEEGHAQRKVAGLRVRQPLALLKISNVKSRILNENELLQLIKDELNVREIEFVEGRGELEVELDTEITPGLKAEGEAREIIRQIQDLRKEAGCRPDEYVTVELPQWPADFEEMIKEKTLARKLKKGRRLALIK